MANVKSRPEKPKGASNKKGVHKKTKKSLTGSKSKKSSKPGNHIIMKRPSTSEIMTPDEKVAYVLQNGHYLKDAFNAKPPPSAKRKPETSDEIAKTVLNNMENNNVTCDDAKPKDQSKTASKNAKKNRTEEPELVQKDTANGKITEKNKKVTEGNIKVRGKKKKQIQKKDDSANSEIFLCDHCNKSFNRKCSIRRHMYIHLDMNPYKCPNCLQGFKSRYKVQAHIDFYHGVFENNSELMLCGICDRFLTKDNFLKHIAIHSGSEGTYKCIFCSEIFNTQTCLMQHERTHMVDGFYKCTLCTMAYRERTRLYMHIKSHLKIKDYVCQYCGKDFLRPNSLTRHLEIFHGGHRIVCPICKKNLKGHLTEHMRTHLKKRPHECPECGQKFTQSTQMNVHRRSHTGARPYPCRICTRKFSHSSALMLHIRRHTGEKPFPCAMCPSMFSQLPHMKSHMLKIHGKSQPYKCSECDTFFKKKSELDNHEKTCVGGKEVESESGIKKARELEMRLSRMRFLLALLLTMIATKEKLKMLGFNKRLIDDLLVESLEAMYQKPCKDESLSPLKRLTKNIDMLLKGTVPKDQMGKFKEENKSTLDILELLTADKEE